MPLPEWGEFTSATFHARERPHVIMDAGGSGHLTHLVTRVGGPVSDLHCFSNGGCTGHDHTSTLVQSLGR